MKTVICPTCGLPCPVHVLPLWRRIDWLLLGTWLAAGVFGIAIWLFLAYTALNLWRY